MEQTVGRYKLLKRLAAGGMGEVYLAAQGGPAGFERVVALKRMLPTIAAEREAVKLFLDEARLVARLSHRNICPILELGEDGGGYFVAMEFVQGASVRALVDRLGQLGEPFPPALAVEIAAQIADALAYAYGAPGRDGQPLRIVHRDVSPHNVLLSTSGDVKLIDFGVAKSADQSHATQSGTIKGKLAYMSPEQSAGEPLDGRSDLFSLGIVLYEMLSGKNPFFRADIVQMVLAIQNETPPPLASFDPALAPADPVVQRLLAKHAGERYADANAAYEDLVELRSRLPRPPKRLGPFVAERFAEDISGLIRSLGDSDVRRALKPAAAADSTPPPAAGQKPAPAESPDHAAPTLLKAGARRANAPQPDLALLNAETMIKAEAAARRSSRGLWAALAVAGVLAAVAAGFLLTRLGPPEPVDRPSIINRRAPLPVAAQPVEPAPAAPEPRKPPAEPPPAAVAATDAPKPPEPPPAATPQEPEKPKPASAARPRPAKPAPVAHAAPPAPPPPAPEPPKVELPPAPVGTVTVSGPFGRSRVALAGPSGHVALARAGELSIGLEYSVQGGALTAKITCDPWAIVAIDGVSKGKTPIALPALGRTPLPLELRRVGADPVSFVLTADVH